jgi:hypothetical protein
MSPAIFLAPFSMRNSRRLASRVARSGLQTRRALTLVEMLISLVCVIILMLAYTQLFSSVSTRIADARSMIDLTNRMRGVANQLRTDLAGHTCELNPPRSPQAGDGYFEYVEGPLSATIPQPDLTKYYPYRWNGMADDLSTPKPPEDESTFLGDTDDVLMFTTRCKNGAFTGKYQDISGTSRTVQSQVAEVVWFLRPTLLVDPSSSAAATTPANPPTYTLYRRTYLVMPTYQGQPTTITASSPPGTLKLPDTTFYENNDLSVHYDLNTGSFVPNTLGDLTKRECRFGHHFDTSALHGFPHRIEPSYLLPFGGNLSSAQYSIDRSNGRYGEDVVLTNVVSFDIQAWDPSVDVKLNNNTAVLPGDCGYWLKTPAPTSSGSTGGFVDLNYNISGLSLTSTFSGPGVSKPIAGGAPSLVGSSTMPSAYNFSWMVFGLSDPGYLQPATYDTWSTHYEHDGLDQDGDGVADQSTLPGNNTPETSPPYPVPLRGIKITLRCYEPDSRQMHEISVVESFVPE